MEREQPEVLGLGDSIRQEQFQEELAEEPTFVNVYDGEQ